MTVLTVTAAATPTGATEESSAWAATRRRSTNTAPVERDLPLADFSLGLLTNL
jgi:hypothetical protein